MKHLYLFLSLVLAGFASRAQTATSYGFSSLSVPFVSIAGTPGTTEAFTIETDDATQTGIPIGFPFTYCGVTYNNLSACSNGWISLSMTAATYSAELFNDPSGIDDGDPFGMGTPPGTGAGWLMPYWYDMDGFSGSAYYTTTGTFPFRVFTFEWNDWEDLGGSGIMSFQVKLHETTNIIDFCYQPLFSPFFTGATIGIANDQISDWQTLSDASATPVVSTTFSSSVFDWPADGQVYEWSPSTCASPITGTLTLCDGATTTLADASTGGTWSSSTPAAGTIDATTGVVTGIAGGTTTITYTTSSTCSVTAVVTVNTATPITGTASVCQGSTTTLSSGPAGGAWSVGLSSIATVDATTGVVTGVLGGITNVSYTTADGCSTFVPVTVNPLPAAITGSTGMCVGTTTALSSTTMGGTWSSSTPPVATVDPATGVVTAIALGTSTISYTLATGCFVTRVVTVNTSVAPITGNPVVCVGTTSALGSTTGGGTWSSSNSNTSVGASGIITGVATGTSTITYSLGAGCLATVEVTVNPAPSAITGVTVLCPGLTAVLSQATGGGTWSSSNTAAATVGITSGIVTGVAGGTSTITYVLPAASGSCPVTTIVTVNPNPNPITGPSGVCQGSTITLSSTTTGVTYTSSATGTATVGSSSGIVTGISPGTVTITGSAGGCFVTKIVTVNPLPAGITGTLAFCSGTTTTLADASTGGTWSSGNPLVAFVAVSTSGVITGGNAGTANITYTLPTGCRSTAIATVNPLPTNITGTTSVCLGLTTTLSSGTGGTWTSSDASIAPVGATTGVVTGSAIGTATISYTLATGCRRSVIVTVNPLPAAISGATSLCPGTTIALSTTATGGAWSSLNTGIATVASTGVVTGVATGLATIRYTLPTGCFSSVVVTVTPAPSAIITPLGDTALCPGGFVTLTASAATGVTYEWYEDGTFIPGAVTSSYTATDAGSYQVRVSQVGGCSIFSVPITVSVFPAVADITIPGGSASGCSGTGVELDGTVGTGFTYQWLLGGAPIAGATDTTYTALTSGSYSLVISNSTGCSATSAAVAITVSSTPAGVVTVSGPLTICAGTHVTFTAAAGLTYQWFKDGAALLGATNATYNASAAGSYYVLESNTAGCSATSAASVVVVNPLPSAAISHTGSTVFCTGSSVALVAIPAGGSFQWYKGGVAIAGATNDTYIATTSGGYRVRVTDANGCSDLTHADTTVIVIGAVSVQPLTPATFCFGGSSLLSTNVSGAGSLLMYQWYLNSIAIPGATSPSYNATVPGSYSCAITVPGSCVVSTPDIPVVERPLPDPIVTFDGTLFHTQGYYVSYQWYKDLLTIPGANSSSTAATTNGTYKVAVTDTNGCQSISTSYVLTGFAGHAAGIVTVNTADVKIYPNPANILVHIAAAGDVKAVITGMDGRELKTVNNAKDIDISNLANGVYMIMVYDTNNLLLKTEKLVKATE